jgi:hypothetical protein
MGRQPRKLGDRRAIKTIYGQYQSGRGRIIGILQDFEETTAEDLGITKAERRLLLDLAEETWRRTPNLLSTVRSGVGRARTAKHRVVPSGSEEDSNARHNHPVEGPTEIHRPSKKSHS